jgi:hypothetical protein
VNEAAAAQFPQKIRFQVLVRGGHDFYQLGFWVGGR